MTPELLTDEQVVRVLAERLGYREIYQSKLDPYLWFGRHPGEAKPFNRSEIPDILNSRDALAPVLAGLSEVQWNKLDKHIAAIFGWTLFDDGGSKQWWERSIGQGLECSDCYPVTLRETLTLPPADLARAVAGVLTAAVPP